ncbi:MAG TPA: hypothetical protein VNG29_03465 [Candidatus Paceibacterota bacterium]|nr:hypothetical protein [Candidatus Paceibacterota bacterium]
MRKRTIFIAIGVIFVAGGGYGLSRLFASRGTPQDFMDARTQGAIIAQNIVNLSNQSASDLQQINADDAKGDYTDAIALAQRVIAQSQDIRDQGVQLSNEVESMTKALSGVSSVDAQQAALESISNRLALISRLIDYSAYLEQLLETLQSHFAGQPQQGAQVQTLVDQINSEVSAINNFNAQAGQAMDRFDKIVSK